MYNMLEDKYQNYSLNQYKKKYTMAKLKQKWIYSNAPHNDVSVNARTAYTTVASMFCKL
jgi:hypothetical protein